MIELKKSLKDTTKEDLNQIYLLGEDVAEAASKELAKNSISLEIAAFVSVTACYIIVQNITDSLKIERSQVKKVITSFLDSITPVENTNDENTEDKEKQS